MAKQPYNQESDPARKKGAREERIQVVLPSALPPLTPESARALLRILIAARARRNAQDKEGEDDA
jgi:hypothetical protein